MRASIQRITVAALLFVTASAAAATLPVKPAPSERPLYYERALTPADLEGRTLRELTLMRNTIYARAGNVFRKKWLHEYFAKQPWYKPSGLDQAKLSAVDKANAEAIAKYEAALPRAELERKRKALAERHAYRCDGLRPLHAKSDKRTSESETAPLSRSSRGGCGPW